MAENHSPRHASRSEVPKTCRAHAKGKRLVFGGSVKNIQMYCYADFFFSLCLISPKLLFWLQDPGRSTGSLSRDFGLSRVVFSCLQSVASSTPGHKPTKKTHGLRDGTQNAAKPSRFAEFHEVSRSSLRYFSVFHNWNLFFM